MRTAHCQHSLLSFARPADLCAGTSTGGLNNKEFRRVGDSPVIGAGASCPPHTTKLLQQNKNTESSIGLVRPRVGGASLYTLRCAANGHCVMLLRCLCCAGAGTYAANDSCAVSCTGKGENFITECAAPATLCTPRWPGLLRPPPSPSCPLELLPSPPLLRPPRCPKVCRPCGCWPDALGRGHAGRGRRCRRLRRARHHW